MGHLFRIEILIMSLQCVENQQLQIFLWDEGVVVKKIMQVYEVEPNYTKGKKLVFYLNVIKFRTILKNINFIDEVLNEKMNFVIQEV